MDVFLQFGSHDNPPMQTIKVEHREKPLWFHEKGLMETATGYGLKLTSPLQVKWNGRWRRVYVCCISNSGTAYIGKPGAWEAVVTEYGA